MKTIGIFTSGHGHGSIAQAIAEKIKQKTKDKYQIKLFFRKEALDFIYNSFYKFSPSSLGYSYRIASDIITSDKKAKKIVDKWFSLKNEKEISNFIKKNKIDLCISTYFICNSTLEKFQKENIPLINVLTDPKTVHPLIFSENATVNLAFDEQVTKNYKNKNIKNSGWFVRSKFENDYDKKIIRKKLKINNDLTFLIVSGSEGANAILKILPSIINCDKKVNFIVACGKNKFLYNNILGIKQSLKRLSSSKANLSAIGFTNNLHLYMQAADLIIGKAGPNTLFESVACETPFFAITHLHGQEDGNLDIIRDYKIGLVEENSNKANQKLEKLIQNPKEINIFTKNTKILKKYNQGSIDVLLKEIDKLLN